MKLGYDTSYTKYIGKCSIKPKKNKKKVISSLQIILMMFISSYSMCCGHNLFEQISFKK